MNLLKSRSRSRFHVLPACCLCAALAAAWLTSGAALAQSIGLGQSSSGGSGLPGSSTSARMGSSSGTGLSPSGSGLGGSSSGMAGGRSGGIGLHGMGGASPIGGAGGGANGMITHHAGTSMPGGSGGAGAGMPGSTRTKPKLALKPASGTSTGAAAVASQYDYNYGAEDTGRDSSTIYKSSEEVAPTDNYKFGATDQR
jgi:hypothetical protein